MGSIKNYLIDTDDIAHQLDHLVSATDEMAPEEADFCAELRLKLSRMEDIDPTAFTRVELMTKRYRPDAVIE
jgi:hypothetical protein